MHSRLGRGCWSTGRARLEEANLSPGRTRGSRRGDGAHSCPGSRTRDGAQPVKNRYRSPVVPDSRRHSPMWAVTSTGSGPRRAALTGSGLHVQTRAHTCVCMQVSVAFACGGDAPSDNKTCVEADVQRWCAMDAPRDETSWRGQGHVGMCWTELPRDGPATDERRESRWRANLKKSEVGPRHLRGRRTPRGTSRSWTLRGHSASSARV